MVAIFILGFNLVWWALSFLPVKYINGSAVLKNYAGMTLAPIVFFKYPRSLKNDRFIRHELCHVKQQRKFSPGLFLLLYSGEYLLLRAVAGMSHQKAYWNLSWEEEARKAEEV